MTLLVVLLWLLLGLLPGLALLVVVRRSAGAAALVAGAPAVSLGLVYAWALVLTAIHVDVTPASVLPVVLGVPLVLAVAVRWRRRAVADGSVVERERFGRPEAVVVAVVSAVAVAIWWTASVGASLVPPNDDGNNHGLYASRILNLHTVDPLVVTVGDLASGTPTGTYYPLGMHTFAAQIAAITGVEVGTVLDVGVILAAGVLLPLGLAVLTRRIFPEVRWAAPLAAMLAVAFPAFPYYPAYWGGITLIVGMSLVAPVVEQLVAVPDEVRPALAGLVAGVALVGVFGVHNTELVTAGLLAVVLMLGDVVRRDRGYRLHALAGLAAAGAVFLCFVLPQLPLLVKGASIRSDIALLKPQTFGTAVQNAWGTFFGLSGLPPVYVDALRDPAAMRSTVATVVSVVLALFVVVGAVVAVRRRRPEWVVCGIAFVLLTVLSAMRYKGADLLALPWYSRWDRVVLNQLFFIATLGAVGAATLAARLAAQRSALVVGSLATALVAVPVASSLTRGQQVVSFAFEGASLAGPAERAGFDFLASHVQPGERVLNDMTDGSGWMYALDGVTPVFTSPTHGQPGWGDRAYLQRHAADVSTDPRARAAADQWRTRWLFVGPRLFPFRKGAFDRDALLASPGWRVVYDEAGVLVFERVLGAGA